jgi:hypothetical protein
MTLRRSEGARIHQMTVAACLHTKTGSRAAPEIECHDAGRPTQESKRRLDHARVAKQDQIGDTPDIALRKHRENIAAPRSHLPSRVHRSRRALSQVLSTLRMHFAQRLDRGLPRYHEVSS